jgi:membrane protease YdiL (CAAX protease family)
MTNRFLDQANLGRNEIWRYLLTILAIVIFSIGAQLFAAIIVFLSERTLDLAELSPMALFLVTMTPFPFALLALAGGLFFLHRRSLITLLNPARKIAWKKIFLSGGLWFGLSALSDLTLALFDPGNYTWAFDPGKFSPYFLAAVVLIPIQTSTEEFVFRGYLTQWAGRYSRRLWFPLLAPSVVFMLLHGLNPEVGAYGMLLTMPVYLGMGLLLGWLTLRSQSLELALGLHAANNLYAALVVTFPNSSLPSPALFSMQAFKPELGLIVFALITAVFLSVIYLTQRQWISPPEVEIAEAD